MPWTLVCLLVAAGCSTRSADDEFTGTIAFVRAVQEAAEGHVHVIGASGENERRVGTLPVTGAPTWSPSGTEIGYADPNGKIVIGSAQGAERQRIEAGCYEPVWSPSGDRIACEYSEPWQIKMIDLDPVGTTTLTPDCCYRPTWSPDGRRLAYLEYGRWKDNQVVGRPGVFAMSAEGRGPRRLTTGSFRVNTRPAWSPDGRTIAFVDGEERVRTVDAAGKRERTLVADGRTSKDLVWSPDGTTLAFTHGDGDYEVFVVRKDGTELRNLTKNEGVQDEHPSWSPDGRALAFTSTRDTNAEIYVMRADGSHQTRLTHDDAEDVEPVWGPVP